ncbi:MAG: DUF3987 domain-containing protein [Microcoleaceae cyanobacterium]
MNNQNLTNFKAKVNNFLDLLGYNPNDTLYFRGFKGSSKGFGKKVSYQRHKINYKELLKWQNEGYGIYFVVNGQGHTDKEVKLGRVIFYEHDNLSKEIQAQLWQTLNLPKPTVQVDTGGKSIHSYWVLAQPIPIEQWKQLQADLLEYADADRSIKNPSRVMRVPGFKHQNSGVSAEIISSSGTRYSYQELRNIIPQQQQQPTLNFDRTMQLDTPSIIIFLTKDDRNLIERGVSQGGRNNAGAKLARNLIGTAHRLNYLGINYNDTPLALFEDYCSRCSPPINSKEVQQIWKSAQKDNPTASLTDDALENCLKAWQKNQMYSKTKTQSTKNNSPSNEKKSSEVASLKDKWNKSKVLAKIINLAEQRPTDSKLTLELKELSIESGWDIYSLKQIYQHTIEDFDSEVELSDEQREFCEILEANVSLNSHAMLPQQLHPLLKFADNLGVSHEPVLVALEAVASSLIDPNTKIIGRECSNYDQNATIFSAIVGEPGSKKSPLIKAIARKPLREMQNEATNKYERDYARYQDDLEDWEVADKSNRGDKPEEPKLRVFSTGDYTPEGLRELSQYNPKILRCFDELAREAKAQGQYKGGKGGDAQLLLESYDGILDEVTRRGKIYPGGTVNQPLLGGIQPKILSDIVSSSDPTGLFARYNIATLDNSPHFWDGDDDVHLDITPLLVSTYKAIDSLPAMTFKLSRDAYQLFKACHNRAENQRIKADSDAIAYQYAKLSGKILRWAMVYHILHAVAQGETPAEIVEKKFIQIAKERAYYQISQVKGILSIMDNSKPSKLFQLHQYALRKGEPITPRDAVYKTKKAKDRGEAIDFFRRLEQMGWGRTITTSRTIKFEAFEEKKAPPPESAESTVTADTSESKSSSNHAQPSHSNHSDPSTETTATTTHRSQTAVRDGDIEDNVPTVTNPSHQPEIKTSLDNQTRSKPPHQSINDFRVGQKVRVDGLSLVIQIAEIDFKKGLLKDEEGTAFKWQRCQIVEES